MTILVHVSGAYYTAAKDYEDFDETFLIPNCEESVARAFIQNCLIVPRLYESREKYKGFQHCAVCNIDGVEPSKEKVPDIVAELFECFIFLIQPQHFFLPEVSTYQKMSVILKTLKSQYVKKKKDLEAKRAAEIKTLAGERGVSPDMAKMMTDPKMSNVFTKIVEEGLEGELLDILRSSKKQPSKGAA